MQLLRRMGFSLFVALGLAFVGGGVAWGQPTIERRYRQVEGSAEVGLQATVVGSGGAIGDTFLGAVFTLQGGHYRPLAAVFQLGVGAGLGEDPADPDKTKAGEQLWMGLGARFRP